LSKKKSRIAHSFFVQVNQAKVHSCWSFHSQCSTLFVRSSFMSIIPKTEKNTTAIPVVDLDSDDEDGTSATMSDIQQNPPELISPPVVSQSQSFWKAGDYVAGPSSKPSPSQGIRITTFFHSSILIIVSYILICYLIDFTFFRSFGSCTCSS